MSEPFEVFRQWLGEIRCCFGTGFALRTLGNYRGQGSFDDETLGGEVGYSTILDSIPRLEGELKGPQSATIVVDNRFTRSARRSLRE